MRVEEETKMDDVLATPQRSFEGELTPVSSAAHQLLSNEVILHLIWLHLDNPSAWSQTNRHFHSQSLTLASRAHWFTTRYAPFEVLFHAIARPKLLSVALFDELVRLGAKLSRNLVQLLYYMRDRLWRRKLLDAGGVESRWGAGVKDSVHVAMLKHAVDLYGDHIWKSFDSTDSATYTEWIQADSESVNPKLTEAVNRIFKTYKFMPLPLVIGSFKNEDGERFPAIKGGNTSMDLRTAFKRDSNLIFAAIENGFQPQAKDTEKFLNRIVGSAEKSKRNELAEMLKVDGRVRVTSSFAQSCLAKLKDALMSAVTSPEQLSASAAVYDILVHLDHKKLLPFKLSSIIEELLQPWQGGSITSCMLSFLKLLVQDFLDLPCVAVLFGRATFLEAELQGVQDLDALHQMMRQHNVTTQDIMQACLRNQCRSVTPIMYALHFVAGFQAQPFIELLVESLLNQSYRGVMLRELDRVFGVKTEGCQMYYQVPFRKLLALAVEKQAFTHAQIPAQQWHLDRTSGGQYTCNAVAPVRSMLAFSYTSGNASAVNLCTCTDKKHSASFELELCSHQREYATHGTRSPWVPGFTRFGGASSEPTTKQDVEIKTGENEAELNERCQNIYGPIRTDDEHIVSVLVELLGPDSYASSICLSHALVNGNAALVDELLARGVGLTLNHFKIALKVGYALPESLLSYIISGAPFKERFHADQEEVVLMRFASNLSVDYYPLEETTRICLSTTGYPAIVVETLEPEPDKRLLRVARGPRAAPVDQLGSVILVASPTNSPPPRTSTTQTSRNTAVQTWLHNLIILKFDASNQSNHLEQAWPFGDLRSEASASLRRFVKCLAEELQGAKKRSVDEGVAVQTANKRQKSSDSSAGGKA